jgi:SNF2 family DNA or RNA helicase
MRHQIEALRLCNGRDFYALFMEQGTGKTWTILADAERCYAAGTIDALFVLAPKGVHTNWTLREIPEHLAAPCVAEAWTSGAGKRRRAEMERLLRPRDADEVVPMRILTMNYDAVMTKDGFEFAARFLRATRAMMVLDESHRVKSPSAGRTQRVMRLRPLAQTVRISTGTPMTNAPLDVFSQFEFMEPGLLGTTSYRAFTAEYAELVPNDSRMMANIIKRNPKAAHAQIVARNPDGSKRYRNLDKLQRLVSPHAYRVLKRQCLDLPEKIYKQQFFDLSAPQRAMYDVLEEELRIYLEDGRIETVDGIAAMVKLQQITSGFVNIDGSPMLLPAKDNPRMGALLEIVEDLDGPFIVWARFREELRQIAAALAEAGVETATYHGATSTADREAAVDGFQSGTVRAFVGQPQAGGIGLTLTKAETVVYYSNDFNLGTRLQSEDRCHRIGTRHNVVYVDLVATKTLDGPIARALQRKTAVAAEILGDSGFSPTPQAIRMGQN